MQAAKAISLLLDYWDIRRRRKKVLHKPYESESSPPVHLPERQQFRSHCLCPL